MKKVKKIVMMVLLISVMGCEQHNDVPLPPRPALVMEVGSIENQNDSMVLVGEVKSRYISNQGFRVAGKIIQRYAEIGDAVKKGQVLVKLDPKDNQLLTQAAGADVLSAKAEYALAEAEVERVRKLVAQKFMSQSALDGQEAQLKTTAARLKQVEAQSNISKNQTRYTTLTADRNGVITSINAEPGQVVQAAEVIAQIADMQALEVLVAVPESKIENVHVNDLVSVRLWSNKEKAYQGKIREIEPAASEATRAFDMRVSVINADAQIKLGMTAGVSFDNNTNQTIMVPSAAVTEQEGKKVVWVIDENNIANPREVKIGAFNENGININSGLEIHERIAIAGVHTLVKGQKVTPLLQTRKP